MRTDQMWVFSRTNLSLHRLSWPGSRCRSRRRRLFVESGAAAPPRTFLLGCKVPVEAPALAAPVRALLSKVNRPRGPFTARKGLPTGRTGHPLRVVIIVSVRVFQNSFQQHDGFTGRTKAHERPQADAPGFSGRAPVPLHACPLALQPVSRPANHPIKTVPMNHVPAAWAIGWGGGMAWFGMHRIRAFQMGQL